MAKSETNLSVFTTKVYYVESWEIKDEGGGMKDEGG